MNRIGRIAAWSAAGVVAIGGVAGVAYAAAPTLTAANAAIRTVLDRHGEGVLVGAGTVTQPFQAREAAAAGAQFLVTPGTRPELAEAVVATGVPAMFGAFTASELMSAIDLARNRGEAVSGKRPSALRQVRAAHMPS
jgi:2-dehydro-3-deoxyphosphogluconate aldolase / (4S)-4-hydroxy-2-oxoglutarate aldolase